MKYIELKRSLENGEVFSAYLFEGEESFFAKKGCALLEEKFLTEPSLNLANFEGSNLDMTALTASLVAYPFMSEKRVTKITEFYPKASEVKELKKILPDLPDTALLIIVNKEKSDALSKIEQIQVVSCVKEESNLVAKWIKAECNRNKVLIDLENALKVAEYCLLDMTRVVLETKKLCDYVGENEEITQEIIDLLVYKDSEYKVFKMTEHIAQKKFDLALSVIQEMLSKGEPPQKILVSIYNYFRKLLHVAISTKTNIELANVLGSKDFVVKLRLT